MLAAPKHAELGHELAERLEDARRRSDQTFAIVRPDSLYERPIAERHRIIFYIGHLEAFDWNLLRGRLIAEKAFDAEFDRLFAFGIDPVDGGLPQDQPSDWPSLDEVRRYVSRVRDAIDAKLPAVLTSSQTRSEFPPSLLLNVAIEHRLMHVETLAYMFHQLPHERKIPQPGTPEALRAPLQLRMVEVPAGQARLGLSRADGAFGWDNEFEAHAVDVPGFAIDKYKVTNREYLRFMAAGGYEDAAFWQADNWKWRTEQNIAHPVFWKRVGDQWLYRTMFADIPLPLDWPVYVSQAEASAYARWAGKSLPTEAQWQRAAYGAGDNSSIERRLLGNADFRRWDPTAVRAFARDENTFGLADMFGDGWEWTSSIFGPFAGFEPFSFYA